jgi:hypothetical protein
MVLAQSPDPGGQGEDFGKSSPVGLVLLILFFIAVAFLVRSMTKHLRKLPTSFDEKRAFAAAPAKVQRAEQARAAKAEESAESEEPGPAEKAEKPEEPGPSGSDGAESAQDGSGSDGSGSEREANGSAQPR